MFAPMLASLADAPLVDPQLVYEPKYDGIRAIAEIEPPRAGRKRTGVRLWSRLGNDKTAEFPDIAAALDAWARARRLKAPVVLDGEIVALDARGEPAGFQQLQNRAGATAFIAFDILREGATDWRDRPLTERRAALERVFERAKPPTLRISESAGGDGRALYARALAQGWEGLIAKHAGSRYKSGKRTPDWRKLKIVREQEFVIAGWTEPRDTRAYFGALLLGVYEGRDLVYAGHVGTGFNEAELERLMKRLEPLKVEECPLRERPKSNARAHWVRPGLVAQVKFTEWTNDGVLRHPVYLGLRDDKKPEDVLRERARRLHAGSLRDRGSGAGDQIGETAGASLVDQLRDLEKSRKNGTIVLPDGDRLSVTNLHKIYWPKQQLTKGDLFRFYVQVAPCLLPVVQDRPLTMKRVPEGVGGPTFYQHRAPDGVPANVRVEHVPGEKAVPRRFIGGSLKTLLYMTQLAAISQDPWFSRVTSPQFADHVALDLDPADGVPFARVLDVARWIRDELGALGVVGFPKTSGADGLHVYVPLPPETPYEAGLLFCQIVATLVAQKHPKVATLERQVKLRGAKVYVDCLQNIAGKTLATAYSARASDWAGASTPLTWAEIDAGVRREDFTIQTLPGRIRAVGDLWKALRTSRGVDLSKVSKYAKGPGAGG